MFLAMAAAILSPDDSSKVKWNTLVLSALLMSLPGLTPVEEDANDLSSQLLRLRKYTSLLSFHLHRAFRSLCILLYSS